jgi:hypothetical protein
MRRPAKKTSQKLSADSQRLISYAQAIEAASSRLEARMWEGDLDRLLEKLLKHEHQESIDAALDYLFKAESAAYDALMESVEAASESCIIEHDGVQYNALLIAAPILAWTRFSIASGPITAVTLSAISSHFAAHILASGARYSIAPTLYSIDQLPRTYAETYSLTQRLAQSAMHNNALTHPANAPETAPFLADTRYLLAAVVAPRDMPMFRWQISPEPGNRATALAQWQDLVTPKLAQILPGCGIEPLLPEAYYAACREADKQIRPVSVRAAVHYLTHALAVEPDQLEVIIGNFCEADGEEQIEEYRVSFLKHQHPEVVYGIVWPLYDVEDGENETPQEITDRLPRPTEYKSANHKFPIETLVSTLYELGIIQVKHLTDYFPMEFCDDCGAPLFPDAQAELTHAEMPEDLPQSASHFH